ncbi:MAG: MBL fold metallo-hydrolase [Anaerolineales bacterium]
MQELAPNVYIEDSYPGVTLGAINLPHGLIQIDAPPSPDDSRTWRATLLNLGGGVERVLINLDAHPDRTLGARAMDCAIIAHERTAAIFRSRPNTFKTQGEETGADWEQVAGLGSIRWAPPEITFTQQLLIEWSEVRVVLEHHPGPGSGAIWVVLPGHDIVFVGDLVVKAQPPFFASADLAQWKESLEVLMSDAFAGYTVVSGRGGVVTAQHIRSQYELIGQVQQELQQLAAQKAALDSVDAYAQKLAASFKAPPGRQSQYTQRLRYGLTHYYKRHYLSSGKEEEE